jgi:hypothetical protein
MRSTNTPALYRPDLGIAVMEFVEGVQMGYIGLEIMPLFPVGEKSAGFPVIPKEVLLKIPDTKRAPRGHYNRGDWQYEEGKYDTSEHGWEEPIDDGERKILESRVPGAGDFIATKRAMGHILRGQEKRIADKLFNAGNFTAHSITNEWDDAANATPITDINAGVMAFRSQCGMLPDALVITYSTFVNLKSCAQIVDRIKYTFPGLDINGMSTAQLAAAFNVPRVLVGGAIYDSAKKGKAASITDLWSNEYAALVKIASGEADLVEPGVGRTFLWTEDSADNAIVEQYRDESIRSDVFRVRHNTDECLLRSVDKDGTTVSNIAAACVYLFSNITT